MRGDLQRQGARNIDVRRNYSGELEVRYTIKMDDPEKDITKILEQNGAQNVRMSSSYNGGRFDFRIDDIMDERELKRKLSDLLRRNGYRSY